MNAPAVSDDKVLMSREDFELYEKMRTLIKHANADKFRDVYFICGEGGEKDEYGLPMKLFVCPGYGADGMAIYTKTTEYSAPEY